MSRSRHVARSALGAALLAVMLAVPGASQVGASPAAPGKTSQTAQLRVLPQLAATGVAPEPAASAFSVLDADFTPAVLGRTVLLQRQSGRSWVTVQQAAQAVDGGVTFNAPYASSGLPNTYRAVAVETPSLRGAATTGLSTSTVGAPIFSDEFTGETLGAAWDHRLQGYNAGSRTCSRTDPSGTSVADGVVRLSVLDDPDKGDCTHSMGPNGSTVTDAYRLNGHVGTQGRFSFRYGYAAARMKFQSLRGQHAAFWMQPNAPTVLGGDPSVSGAEIDIIEWFGTGSPGLANFVYYFRNGAQVKHGGVILGQDQYGSGWADQFHVFSVEWTPTSYVFRIDGKETLRTSEGISQIPQYLILSLLSSDYELAHIKDMSLLPQTTQVDWVRVWAP